MAAHEVNAVFRVRHTLLAGLIGLASVASVSAAQSADVRGWSIGYADGRVVTHVLKDKGGMWTPLFPKIRDISIGAGGPAKYLDVQYVTDREDLVATVSLATQGFQDRVRVAIVRVGPGRPARVDQLTAFGVEPVILSLVSIEAVAAYPAMVTEPSGQLLVRVEPARPDAPIYRFEVVNQSGRALRAFDFEGYQGDARILSGRRKTERNEPLVLPADTYSFVLTIGNSEGKPWRTLDRIVLSSVVWDDGAVDGDAQPALIERNLARSRAEKLRNLLSALEAPGATNILIVRAAFMALDRSDYSLENARNEALGELDRLPAGNGNLDSWLTTKIAQYSAWLERCAAAAQMLVGQ